MINTHEIKTKRVKEGSRCVWGGEYIDGGGGGGGSTGYTMGKPSGGGGGGGCHSPVNDNKNKTEI